VVMQLECEETARYCGDGRNLVAMFYFFDAPRAAESECTGK